jgi:dTDP-4-amino-4,6-dideoxygalactose transaminase
LRGAIPVFADICANTQCLDPDKIERLITKRTRAILPVHYAGIGCDMDMICQIAQAHSLSIIEDAAQAIGATYKGMALGLFGQLGALSFHDSKNISSGEGGALLINDEMLTDRAEILWEKGTNRHQFSRGMVDKYTWVDMGSSFLPSEVTAAFLLGQLERTELINNKRIQIWDKYFNGFAEAETRGICDRPYVPESCSQNGHIFYLIMSDVNARNGLLAHLHKHAISATFHYIPLHDSIAGRKFGRAPHPLPNTERAGNCLIRLPLFPDLTNEQQERIIQIANDYILRNISVHSAVK